MKRFIIAVLVTAGFCFQNISFADETLDPGEFTVNGKYKIAVNWSELKRGWNSLILKITDAEENRVSEASVTVTYDMIGMPMNPPDKPVEEKSASVYEKKVFLGMQGKWQFDISVIKNTVEDTLKRIEDIKK
jgi:hypothetical protein